MTDHAVCHVEDLPLRYRTPPAWAAQVLRDPMALLSDHAHLEKKAAGNALELLNRWPQPGDHAGAWVAALAGVARDESDHLLRVTRLLTRHGGRMSRQHKNPYANALRGLVRLGQGNQELLDRLLVSALIEARSCERFELLASGAGGGDGDGDAELSRLYASLCASERGHYRVFLELADMTVPGGVVEQRWSVMLEEEARIAAGQAPGPRMHSGVEALGTGDIPG